MKRSVITVSKSAFFCVDGSVGGTSSPLGKRVWTGVWEKHVDRKIEELWW